MRVLHVTPHLGGGVGTVLREYFRYEVLGGRRELEVLSLDSVNTQGRELLTNLGVSWQENAFFQPEALDEAFARADVVLVHWWNHPLLHSLLLNHRFPPARIVFWSHISGSPSPNNFNETSLDFPDRFVFTTPLSFYAPEIQRLPSERQREFSAIWSTAGVERLDAYLGAKDGSEKIVGYTGNLDFSKVHAGFLEACVTLGDSGAKFQIIGPPTAAFELALRAAGPVDRVSFAGFLDEDTKFKRMSKFSVFGYPLARHHYATCDQALQEAMFLGAVPVVLNNPMESYMVRHGKTGLVARDINEYVHYVRRLLDEDSLRQRISQAAHDFAAQEYSLERMAQRLEVVLNDLLDRPKRRHGKPAAARQVHKPYEVFLDSLSAYGGIFRAYAGARTESERSEARDQIATLSSLGHWSSPTKSSPSHYAQYFPEDPLLKVWSELTSRRTDAQLEEVSSVG